MNLVLLHLNNLTVGEKILNEMKYFEKNYNDCKVISVMSCGFAN